MSDRELTNDERYALVAEAEDVHFIGAGRRPWFFSQGWTPFEMGVRKATPAPEETPESAETLQVR